MLLTWAVSRSSGKGPGGTRGMGDRAALAGHAALSCLAEIYPVYICLVSWRQYRQGFFVQSNVLLLRVKRVIQVVPQRWPWCSSFHAGAAGARLYQTLLQGGQKLMRHHQNTLGSSHGGKSGDVWRTAASQGSHPGSGLPLGMVVPPLPVLPSSRSQGCQTRELIWLRMNTDPGRIYARLKLL